MVKDILMGIDIGTTGCKTILVDNMGTVVAREIEAYPFYSPKHGWAEQNPQDWWEAVKKTIGKITKSHSEEIKNLRGIGLSGQMHGLVALDESSSVVYGLQYCGTISELKSSATIYMKRSGVLKDC